MSLIRATLRNTVSVWLARGVAMLVQVVAAPVLVTQLGSHDYGLWLTIGQTVSTLMLLDLGVGNSIAVLIARHRARGDDKAIEETLSTAMTILLAGSAAVLVAAAALSPLIPRLFDLSGEAQNTAFHIFLLAALHVCLVFPLRVARGLLQAENRFDVISKVSAVVSLVRLGILLAVFGQGYGNVLLLAVLTVGWNLAGEVTMFFLARRQHPAFRLRRIGWSRAAVASLLSRGLSGVLKSLSQIIYGNLLIVAVGAMLGLAVVPLIAIPISIMTIFGAMLIPLGGNFFPIASGMFALREQGRLRHLSMFGVRYAMTVGLPVAVFLIFFGEDLFFLWLGRSSFSAEEIRQIALSSAIMIVPLVISRAQSTSRSVLVAMDRHWLVANVLLFNSAIALVVGIVLMHFAGLGVTGAAIGWTCRALLGEAVIFSTILCRELRIPSGKYLRTVYAAPVAATVVASACCPLIEMAIPGPGVFPLLGKALLFAMIGLPLYGSCLSAEHRRSLWAMLSRRVSHDDQLPDGAPAARPTHASSTVENTTHDQSVAPHNPQHRPGAEAA